MKPQSQVLISDSFQNVEIQEPGFYKTINTTIFQKDFILEKEIQLTTENISLDTVIGCFTLAPYLDYTRFNDYDFTFNSEAESNDWVDYITRQDDKDRWIAYQHNDSQHYPFSINVTSGFLKDDQSFAVEIEKSELSEDGQAGSLIIFIKGISPVIIDTVQTDDQDNFDKLCDTLCIQFPLYENSSAQSKYGFADWIQAADSVWDISEICLNTQPLSISQNLIHNWLIPEQSHILVFKRIDDCIYVSLELNGPEAQIQFNSGADFTMQDMEVKLVVNCACPTLTRFADIKYQDTGSINIKYPIGYLGTQNSYMNVSYSQVLSDNSSSVSTADTTIVGEYFKGTINLSTEDNYYTPFLHRFNIGVEPLYVRNNGWTTTEDITSLVVSWSINRQFGGTPTATITIDNSKLDYTYTDFTEWLDKQIRIFGGYDETGLKVRFTGIVEDISFDRSSPSLTQITIKAKGISSRLDKICLYHREYDGQYHTDAIVDLCSQAQIANVLTESPINIFDMLYYGKTEAKYQIKIGDTFRSLINRIIEFSGWVLDEDEYGNIIYAPRQWRNTGFATPLTYGIVNLSDITIQYFRNFTSEDDISSLAINTTQNNLRNAVIVMGIADKEINASPSGLYPAYKRNEIITCIRENQDLIDRMGHRVPVVFRKPELCTPEQCIYVAEKLLRILSEAEKTCDIVILADENYNTGMVSTIDDRMLVIVKYLFPETLVENYNNGVYTMSINGPLTDSPPTGEDYV